MNIYNIAAIVTGVIGIFGIIYTIYYGRANRRQKLLIYDKSLPIPIAEAFSAESEYRLSIVFQKEGSDEERLESVYTSFLRFLNVGKEPILDSDIAPSNPVRVEVKGSRVLDIQIAGMTREVNNVSLKNQRIGDTEAVAEVNFDFLDHNDGAIIKIVTAGISSEISLLGDIIGMPQGIRSADEVARGRPLRIFKDWFSWILLVVMCGALTLSAYIYYWVAGAWNHIWLLTIPMAIVILAAYLEIRINQRLNTNLPFPRSLQLPRWTRLYDIGMRRTLYDIKEENKKEEQKSRNQF